MYKMNIAFAKFEYKNNLDEVLNYTRDLCTMAKKSGADLIIFPQMWTNGFNLSNMENTVIENRDRLKESISNIASILDMAICLPYLGYGIPGYEDCVSLYDRFGAEIIHSSRIAVSSKEKEKGIQSGKELETNILELKDFDLVVGVVIGEDSNNLNNLKELDYACAELIINPLARNLGKCKTDKFRKYSKENGVAIAMCNYPSSHEGCDGHSVLYHGIDREYSNEFETEIEVSRLDESSQMTIVELNVTKLLEYRQEIKMPVTETVQLGRFMGL